MHCPRSKEKILICACEMFHHNGYQATSVDDIIRRCGVVKSNFYYHFKSKEELGFAVIEIHFLDFAALVESTLGNTNVSPAKRLELFFDRMCSNQQAEKTAGCPFGNLAAGLAVDGDETSERFRHRLCELFDTVQLALRRCLLAGVECGDFRPDIVPEEMAFVLLAALEGTLMLAKTHRDCLMITDRLRALSRLLRP